MHAHAVTLKAISCTLLLCVLFFVVQEHFNDSEVTTPHQVPLGAMGCHCVPLGAAGCHWVPLGNMSTIYQEIGRKEICNAVING